MAVLNVFPGITVLILIDGIPAQEHEDIDDVQAQHEDRAIAEYQISRTISKYIQSKTGQNFSIKFTAGPPYVKGKNMEHVKLGFHIYVDGRLAGKVWLSRPFFKKHEEGTVWIEEMKGVKEGKGLACIERNFAFAKIESKDNGNCEQAKIERLAQRLRQVGTIEIRVYHEGNAKSGGNSEVSTKGFLEENGTVVPESALKGDSKSHGTALGQAKKAKRGDFFRTVLKDGEDWPLAIYRFLYRDEESLKQMHVIDRTPSPSPSPSPPRSQSPSPEPEVAPPDSPKLTAEQQAQVDEVKAQAAELVRRLTEENTRKLAAERAASIAAGASGKKKESSRREAKKIKRERGEEHREKMRAAKRAKTRNEGREGKAPPGFIDLTGEDDEEGSEEEK